MACRSFRVDSLGSRTGILSNPNEIRSRPPLISGSFRQARVPVNSPKLSQQNSRYRGLEIRPQLAGVRLFGNGKKAGRCTASRSTVRIVAAGKAEEEDLVSRRLDSAGRAFKRTGTIAFWSQLVLSVVSAAIVVFSIIYRQATRVNTEVGLYLNLFGVLMGFLSVIWAVGYTKLGRKLRQAVDNPEEAPGRDTVCIPRVISGIVMNVVGLGATLMGLESTCGLLFAKSLSFAAQGPFAIGAQATAPVLALDIFVVQASANTLLSHFIGLCCSLWLYNMLVNQPPGSAPQAPTPEAS